MMTIQESGEAEMADTDAVRNYKLKKLITYVCSEENTLVDLKKVNKDILGNYGITFVDVDEANHGDFKCKMCVLKFYAEPFLLEHEEKHCPTCSELFHTKELMFRHLDLHCTFKGCSVILRDEEDRRNHRPSHNHPTKPFQCPRCTKRYKHNVNKLKHMKYCNLGSYMKCRICNKEFFMKSHYDRHLKEQHPKKLFKKPIKSK